MSLSLDMDTLTSLCKRRGFIYPSSELYGGLNGFFDYGPLGVELKNNIKQAWWQDMVHRRDDVVGLDSAIIGSAAVWNASGHVSHFSDPMVDCKLTKTRYRGDQLFFAAVQKSDDGALLGYVSALEGPNLGDRLKKQAKKLCRSQEYTGAFELLEPRPYTEAEDFEAIPSPESVEPGTLTPPRDFNLMFQTQVGAVKEESGIAYLRPETAQSIFVNFKNVVDTTRVKVPFGIAQVGKAFRNEITPRNFVFRSREFEQMELEYFIEPDESAWRGVYEQWLQQRFDWHVSLGLRRELLSLEVHPDNKLAHYAKACTDICFAFPFGVQELEGVAARGNFDLKQHQEASGKPIAYFDSNRNESYLPHVIEPSLGVERMMLAVLCSAYSEDSMQDQTRTFLKFHPRLAPLKVAVLPLVKNKPEIVEKARAIYGDLQKRWNVFYDETGAIGRRYRRMDEVGTPMAVTIDFESLETQDVTVRDRDSGAQVRVSMDQLIPYLDEGLTP